MEWWKNGILGIESGGWSDFINSQLNDFAILFMQLRGILLSRLVTGMSAGGVPNP
jgi:hypothetical protein